MDETALRLGHEWQPEAEAAIQAALSAAIFLGPDGLGKWQDKEIQACRTQRVERRIPVIPVLLPGGPAPEELSPFLRELTCVDLRSDATGAPLQRLIQTLESLRPKLSEPLGSSLGPRAHNLPFRLSATFSRVGTKSSAVLKPTSRITPPPSPRPSTALEASARPVWRWSTLGGPEAGMTRCCSWSPTPLKH